MQFPLGGSSVHLNKGLGYRCGCSEVPQRGWGSEVTTHSAWHHRGLLHSPCYSLGRPAGPLSSLICSVPPPKMKEVFPEPSRGERCFNMSCQRGGLESAQRTGRPTQDS